MGETSILQPRDQPALLTRIVDAVLFDDDLDGREPIGRYHRGDVSLARPADTRDAPTLLLTLTLGTLGHAHNIGRHRLLVESVAAVLIIAKPPGCEPGGAA